jgi:hypothetical protein
MEIGLFYSIPRRSGVSPSWLTACSGRCGEHALRVWFTGLPCFERSGGLFSCDILRYPLAFSVFGCFIFLGLRIAGSLFYYVYFAYHIIV